MKSIAELQGEYTDATIHVFGSGAGLNRLDPLDFFTSVTIAMNRVPLVWPVEPTFALTKYHEDALELQEAGFPFVVGKGDRGYLDDTDLTKFTYDGAYYFDHYSMMPHGTFNVGEHWPYHPDSLVVGPTVQMTAIHFAAYLGAKDIVMHGCSGHGHVTGYYPDATSRRQAFWLDDIREVVQITAEEVERRYGAKVTWVN